MLGAERGGDLDRIKGAGRLDREALLPRLQALRHTARKGEVVAVHAKGLGGAVEGGPWCGDGRERAAEVGELLGDRHRAEWSPAVRSDVAPCVIEGDGAATGGGPIGVVVAQDHGGATAGRDRDQVVRVGLDLDVAEVGEVVVGVLQVGSEGLAPPLAVLLLGGVLGEQRREVGGEGRAGRGQDGHVGLLGACDFRLTWNGARANPMAWVGARGVL